MPKLCPLRRANHGKHLQKRKPLLDSVFPARQSLPGKQRERQAHGCKGAARKKRGEIAKGKIPGIHFEKVKFDELAEDLLRDYRINGKKSLIHMEIRVRHLKKHFEGMPASKINTPQINKYVEKRLSENAANGTINRELNALKTMFSLGSKCNPPKVLRK